MCYNKAMDEETDYCVNCGEPLPPGEHYKCELCLEVEMGILDPEYGPPGVEDTFEDYEKQIEER